MRSAVEWRAAYSNNRGESGSEIWRRAAGGAAHRRLRPSRLHSRQYFGKNAGDIQMHYSVSPMNGDDDDNDPATATIIARLFALAALAFVVIGLQLRSSKFVALAAHDAAVGLGIVIAMETVVLVP